MHLHGLRLAKHVHDAESARAAPDRIERAFATQAPDVVDLSAPALQPQRRMTAGL